MKNLLQKFLNWFRKEQDTTGFVHTEIRYECPNDRHSRQYIGVRIWGLPENVQQAATNALKYMTCIKCGSEPDTWKQISFTEWK